MTKFIKEQWLYILLIVCSLCYAVLKLNDGQYADALFALSFMLVALKASFLKAELDELKEEHHDLLADYVDELKNTISFIDKTKSTLTSVRNSVNPLTGELITNAKPKRGRPKKVVAVQPAKGKRGRPRKNA